MGFVIRGLAIRLRALIADPVLHSSFQVLFVYQASFDHKEAGALPSSQESSTCYVAEAP